MSHTVIQINQPHLRKKFGRCEDWSKEDLSYLLTEAFRYQHLHREELPSERIIATIGLSMALCEHLDEPSTHLMASLYSIWFLMHHYLHRVPFLIPDNDAYRAIQEIEDILGGPEALARLEEFGSEYKEKLASGEIAALNLDITRKQ